METDTNEITVLITEITINGTTIKTGQVSAIRQEGRSAASTIAAGSLVDVTAIQIQQSAQPTLDGILTTAMVVVIVTLEGQLLTLPPQAFVQPASNIIKLGN